MAWSPLLSSEEYVRQREAYGYRDPACQFIICQTGTLSCARSFHGIYPARPPRRCPNAISLRHFEAICQEVFRDVASALDRRALSQAHEDNLVAVSCAIVHWKMASQPGRATRSAENVRTKWNSDTAGRLIEAYLCKSIGGFRIGGVRIPTASAFIRLLYPGEFGILDSRVAKFTEQHAITSLSLRDDGYINDTASNIHQFNEKYLPFLRREAGALNAVGTTYREMAADGTEQRFPFRPCDVEMAIWQR